jgi:hypothetical protein
MLRLIFALTALAAVAAPAAAQTPLQKCRAITDSAERLKCFDALQTEPAITPLQPAQPSLQPAQTTQPTQAAPAAKPAQPAKPAASAADEDPMITKAKETVKSQLRDAESARFARVKLRTVGGKQAVCGLVSAKNLAGVMPPGQPFAFDGEQAYLVIYNPGPANITSMDARKLGEAMTGRIKAYNRLCR